MITNNAPQIKHLHVEMENAVRNYLYNYCEEHDGWKSNLVKDNKNLIDCINYITKMAKEKATNGVAMIADDVVYGWAIQYYEDDTIVVEEEKPAPAPASTTTKKSKKSKKEDNTEQIDFFSQNEDKADAKDTEDDAEEEETDGEDCGSDTEEKDQDPDETDAKDTEEPDNKVHMSVSVASPDEIATAEGRAVAMLPDSAFEQNDAEDDEDDLLDL